MGNYAIETRGLTRAYGRTRALLQKLCEDPDPKVRETAQAVQSGLQQLQSARRSDITAY